MCIRDRYTTRLPRNSIERQGGSSEYRFVSEAEYYVHKAQSKKWDERLASGFKYGIDIEEVERNTLEGVVYLTTMLPHAQTLKDQKNIFACPVFQVLVDVPLEVCNRRLLERGHETGDRPSLQSKLDVHECLESVDAQFVPLGTSLGVDISRFCVDFATHLNLGGV